MADENDGIGESNTSLPTEQSELVALLETRQRVVEVCQALRGLIDSVDEHYVVQIKLASCGVIPALFDLLSSEDSTEAAEICETVSALCANIEGVSVRKRSGLETGFQERSFNPVQGELAEVDGIRKLVDLLDSADDIVKEAATQALWSCCSFNQINKMACLRCLVHDLLNDKIERLEQINAFLLDIDIREDVKVLLDQIMFPVLDVAKDEESAFRRDALTLLGVLCERHPASATFLCDEGALEPIVSIILKNEELRSKCVHMLWHLIRHNKTMLKPARGKLGCEGTHLINPLLSMIGWDKEARSDSDHDEQEDDYSDEALLVLKALAEQDADVREKVGDFVDTETSRCSMM